MIKRNKLNVQQQYAALKRYYPNAVMESDMHSFLTWEEILKSSPLGDDYRVRLTYKLGEWPKVYVKDPLPLLLPSGEDRLPHVYSHSEQRLCLFYGKEWTAYRTIAYTVIPWAIEWLYHYELWLVDGIWKGGGTQH